MAPIHFLFSQIDEEIDAISKVAEPFVWRTSQTVFAELRTTMDNIRGARAGQQYNWSIRPEFPLLTASSNGEYEPGGRGAYSVHAKITSIWGITPLGPHNRGSWPHRRFALVGQASTMVRLIEGSPDNPGDELAMWRMEIGDDASPGCHFHVHALGDRDEPPFPHYLPIPRLPGLLLSPLAVLEFTLAELFQDKWREHAAKETRDLLHWRSIQQVRLRTVLRWLTQNVEELAGSPWTALKSQKPPEDLFFTRF
jgi:hypothetical protein